MAECLDETYTQMQVLHLMSAVGQEDDELLAQKDTLKL